MANKVALVAGATGLVGRELLQQLLADPYYSQVIAVTRRPTGIVHERYKEQVVDFDRLDSYAGSLVADDVFCCMGTTIKQAKSREVMYRIDVEYPLALAMLAREQGASQYVLISAMGANAASRIWYSRMKGELEQQLQALAYPSLAIVRPALLLGERQERRAGESAASLLFRGLNGLFKGPLKRYKAIEASAVARAMAAIARSGARGVHAYSNADLHTIANNA